MSDAGLKGHVLRPHSDAHVRKHTDMSHFMHVHFAQMYVEGSKGFSLESEIGLGLVAAISHC